MAKTVHVESERAYFKETFGLTEENVQEYADVAASFAVYRGLVKKTESVEYLPMQFCLTPSRFSSKIYEYINEKQRIMNELIYAVAESDGFLASCFEHANHLDDFNTRLWKIQKVILKEGITQRFKLLILRSDYMLHVDEASDVEVRLVENSTMAVDMGSFSSITREIYEYIFCKLGKKELTTKVPCNDTAFGLALGLQKAWQHYLGSTKENCAILFVVGHTSHICNRALEFDTWRKEKRIRVLQHTFEELRTAAALLEDRKLFVDNLEVAVVCYCWGHRPEHYAEEDWALRLMIERSAAIKIPTVAYQLAGTKKVLQELSVPSVLRSFASERVIPKKLMEVIAPRLVLDLSNKDNRHVQKVLQCPEKYVLNPDRPGEENSMFGEDIVKFINSYEKKESNELYILAEKINPPLIPNYVVQPGCPPRLKNVTMKIGVYGLALTTPKFPWENSIIGYVVESKEYGRNEDLSFLDALFLN